MINKRNKAGIPLKHFIFSILPIFLIPAFSFAELGLEIDGSLNKKEITNLYFDGDFNKVTYILENYRKSHPEMRDEDKIFIYKYLAVVYAANPATIDKGEAYMYQLLKMVPSIELLDMYISDNIRAIFKNVKSEYQRLMSYRDSSKTQVSELKESKPENTQSEAAPVKANSNSWMWWTAGGVGLAAIVTTFVLLGGDDDPNNKPLVIEN